MTTTPPPDPDELASDLVDGVLPAGDAARLRADPEIAARVEAIEALRAAMRVPPPSTAGAVDRAVAATFAALDADSAPPPTRLRAVDRPAPPPTAHLPAPASTYSGQAARSAKPWLAAAAAIVLIGLVTVGVLSNRGSDQSSSDTAAVAPKSAQESAGDASSSGGGSGGSVEQQNGEGNASAAPSATSTAPPSAPDTPSASAQPPTSAVSGVADLGAITDATELADRLRSSGSASVTGGKDGSAVLSDSEGSAFGDGSGSGCPGFGLAGDPAHGEVVRVADATFRGGPVRVHVYATSDGSQRLVATDASCIDVVDVPYTP
jgi:hypothetical protein